MKTNTKLIVAVIVGVFCFALGAKAQNAENVQLPVNPNPQPTVSLPTLSLNTSELKLNNNSFQAGEEVKGSFKLKNLTDYYSSGLYYEVRLYKSYVDDAQVPVFFLENKNLYDLTKSQNFNITPQEEKAISFSYSIPQGLPAGELYYIDIVVYSARSQMLSEARQKISINNQKETEFIFLDSDQAKVFGQDKVYKNNEGPSFTYGQEYQPAKDDSPEAAYNSNNNSEPIKNLVKTKIYYRNQGETISKPIIKFTTYRYGQDTKSIKEAATNWPNPISKDSFGTFNFNLPLFQDPGSYQTVVQIFDGDKKISNPLGIRYITAGDGGLLYDFLVEKKSDKDFVAHLGLAGPADFQYNRNDRGAGYEVAISATEVSSGKKCLDQKQAVDLANGSNSVDLPFSLDNCQAPYFFGASLYKNGKVVDSESSATASKQQLEEGAKNREGAAIKKKTAKYLPIAIIILILLIAIIWIIVKVIKKSKNKNFPLPPPGMSVLILAFLVAASLVFASGASAYGAPSITAPANGSTIPNGAGSVNLNWNPGAGFSPVDTVFDSCTYTASLDSNWMCSITNRTCTGSASWYALSMTNPSGQAVPLSDYQNIFSNSTPLPTSRIPGDGTYNWKISAKTGTHTINQTCTQVDYYNSFWGSYSGCGEYAYNCLSWADADNTYTQSASVDSSTFNFKKYDAPTITFTADSYTVPYNSGTTLRYNISAGATCTFGGSWSGGATGPVSSSQAVNNLTANATYTINCNSTGGSKSASVTVNVTGYGNPSLTAPANGIAINASGNTTFSWQPAPRFTPGYSCDGTGTGYWDDNSQTWIPYNCSWGNDYYYAFVIKDSNGNVVYGPVNVYGTSYDVNVYSIIGYDGTYTWSVSAVHATISNDSESVVEFKDSNSFSFSKLAGFLYPYLPAPSLASLDKYSISTMSPVSNWVTFNYNDSSDAITVNPNDYAYEYLHQAVSNAAAWKPDNRFEFPDTQTSFPITAYISAFMVCGNDAAANEINYWVLDENKNVVKKYSADNLWYAALDSHSAYSVNYNLSLDGVPKNKKLFLVVQQAYFTTNSDDAWWYRYYYLRIPFSVGPLGNILTVNKSGTGTVISDPPGISCDPTCTAAFNGTVRLTANPASGIFSGGCSGTGICDVLMDSAKTVTATFNSCSPGSITYTCSKTIDCSNVSNCGTANNVPSCIKSDGCTSENRPLSECRSNGWDTTNCPDSYDCPACANEGSNWKETAP